MRPQEPLVPPPMYQPTVQQRITDAGGQAGFYGQTPAEQEAGRWRQGGGAQAAGMPAEDWAMRGAHDAIRQSAAYADADRRRRAQPTTHQQTASSQMPPYPGFSSTELGSEMGLSPSWRPTSPEDRPSSPSTRSASEGGVGLGVFFLILTAVVCLPPFLHHNTGVGFGHLGWDVWKLIAFVFVVVGPVWAVVAFVQGVKGDSRS